MEACLLTRNTNHTLRALVDSLKSALTADHTFEKDEALIIENDLSLQGSWAAFWFGLLDKCRCTLH